MLAGLTAAGQAGWGQDTAAGKPAPKPKWEYKLVKEDDLGASKDVSKTEALNRMGEDGWELVWVDAPARTPAANPAGMAETLWGRLANGRDKIDAKDPANEAVRERVSRLGLAIPDDGLVTKEMYVDHFKKRMASLAEMTAANGVTTYYFKRAKN